MESIELKKMITEIGNTVHSMNTIAVSLSLIQRENVCIPDGLDISWKPTNIENSKRIARTFACKSTYVYVAENLFEYLDSISKNPLWKYADTNFKGEDKKANKVYSFLKKIPNIDHELIILAELLCHWRNRIVHSSSSNAGLSKRKKEILSSNNDKIYKLYHHFDSLSALEHFETKKVTLKDVSTLTTVVIKCCKAVDEHYFRGISEPFHLSECANTIKSDVDFKKIFYQPKSKKRNRQINRWIELHYPYLSTDKMNSLLDLLK